LWSACVLWPLLRRRWAKAAVALYPVATLFGIVVTANHYWIDAVGGALIFGAAYGLARAFDRWRAGRRPAAQPVVVAPSEDAVATVDDERVARVVGGGGAGEVHGDPAKVLGHAPATYRHPR